MVTGEQEAKKHPCPDCVYCQWCGEDRCRLCRECRPARGRKLSLAEQVARYEQLNRDVERGKK